MDEEKQKVSEVLELEDQALLYIQSPGSMITTLAKEISCTCGFGDENPFLEKKSDFRHNGRDG